MAQQVNVTLTDDLDGTEADDTVRFGIDGQFYEIDLSTKHAKELRDGIFGKYVPHARKASAASRATRRRSRSPAKPVPAAEAASGAGEQYPVDNDTIRQWGKDHGWDVKDKGRVPARLKAEYAEAMEKKLARAG